MTKKKSTPYAEALINRVNELLKISGLEVSGFAEYTGVSESHIYAILNGTRELTGDTLDKIAESFNLKAWQLLKLDYKLTGKIRKIHKLNNFYVEYKGVKDYFVHTREERNAAFFIENTLLKTRLFNSPVYVFEVREACKAAGKSYESKRVSQILNYLVEKKLLKSKKKPIKLKSGKTGKRIIDVFYK